MAGDSFLGEGGVKGYIVGKFFVEAE